MPNDAGRGSTGSSEAERPQPTDDTLPSVGAPAAAAEPELACGDAIGRFVVLGVLGSGGMGHVYSAYDRHLDRKVAIKLLRAEAVRAEVADARTRLLREAQAMAKINHPNVIKVHEVGTYSDQVYVAMEFADGGTLRAWLAGRRTPRAILDACLQAGRGLAAAHAVGLVHRDFKPDNVLMGKDGSVRVTDFGLVGVAVPTELGHAPTAQMAVPDLSLSGSTLLSQDLTRTGAIMGTPAYMAPEQFGGLNATPFADQFSFCVVLYEALYGARPFDGSSFQEIAANVLEGRVSPAPGGARVPGWLRRVLLRGMSADPAARHASMNALLSELLRDRTRRRRRILAWTVGGTLAVGAAAVAVIALRSGDGAACDAGAERTAGVWSAERRDQMRIAFLASGRPHAATTFARLTPLLDAWSRSWEDGYRDACQDTRVRGEQSEHLLDLRMQCLTRRLDETAATIALLSGGGGDAVDRALEAARALPPIAPCGDAAALTAAVAPPETELLRAQVQAVRGRLDEARGLERLGRYRAALDVSRAALAAARATGYRPVTAEALLVVGRNRVELADPAGIDGLRESMHAAAASGDSAGMIEAAAQLVHALVTQGGRYELAQEIAELADAVATHARPSAELAVRLQSSIGLLDDTRGRPAEARARYTAALALAESELGGDHPATLSTLTHLGNLANSDGRYADARALFERVLAARERISGKDHPDVAEALNHLGHAYRIEGKLDDAKRLFERALAIRIAALGPDHPAVGGSYNSLGALHFAKEDHATAVSYYTKALALEERAYGPDNVELASVVTNLGLALNAQGKREQAVKLFERAIALHEAAHGPEHLSVAGALMNLGIARQWQRRLDEALALYRRAARLYEQTYGPDHPDLADALGNAGTVLQEQHKLDEAHATSLRVLRIFEKAYGAEHPRVGMALVNIGDLQIEEGDPSAALESYRRSATIFEARLGKDHLFVSYALRGVGSCLVKLRRTDEAIPLLERASRIRTASGSPPVVIGELRSGLAEPLVLDPRTRARELAEVKIAAAKYEQTGDAVIAAEVRSWLSRHR